MVLPHSMKKKNISWTLPSESLLLPPPFIAPLFSFGQEGFKALGMGDNNINLPPGFRFYPTDEELIVHFLHRKASLLPCHPDVIPDLDLYPYEPWELQGKAWCEGRKWYFYSRKAPCRSTGNGYWHPIRPEEPVFTSSSCRKVGFKQCYAFHLGESPRGVKTSWIMHEYRLPSGGCTGRSSIRKGLNKIDQSTWVLCRVYDCDDDQGGDGAGGVELSCLDEVFLSLDDMDEISLPN